MFERLGKRAMRTRRETWDSYVAALRTRYDARSILKANEAVTRGMPASRGQSAHKPDPATEVPFAALPPKTLLLTFDDGPHPRYTDRIREILIQHGAPAVFFHVGQNLGQIANDEVALGRAAEATKRLTEAGIALGNHSFTHPVLTERPRPDSSIDAAGPWSGSTSTRSGRGCVTPSTMRAPCASCW